MALALKKRPELHIDDLASLAAEVKVLRHDVTKALRRMSRNVDWDGASEIAEQIGDQASTLYKGATRQGKKGLRILNRQLREQPAISVVAAFAVGLLISRLMSTRD